MSAVEHVLAVQNKLGEGPVWNADEQALYWVDIEQERVHRLQPATGAHDVFELGLPVGALGFRASGGLVMATRDGFALWDPQAQALRVSSRYVGASPRGRPLGQVQDLPLLRFVEKIHLRFIADPEADRPDARFNDGAVDRQGRFWAGTMGQGPTSSLYRLDPDGSVHRMETGVTIANGIGWSPDNRTMYFTDSPLRVIYAYDFDPTTGAIDNRRPFVHTPDEEGVPDGLVVDRQGFVWSARWGGWKVTRYDPTGCVEREVRLPVQYPTSCTFGGPRLDELYITSAWTALSEEERGEQRWAGDLFRLRAGVRGLAEPKFLG